MKFSRAPLALLAVRVSTLSLGAAAVTPPPGVPTAADILHYAELWGSSACCASLSFVLGSKVTFPLGLNYIGSQASYWSQQEALLIPDCIVQPESTSDVQKAVYILSLFSGTEHSCNFAIKGAGHTPFSGAANINSGVTIDMGKMNTLSVNTAKTVASIGPGSRWVDVYNYLGPLNLMVTGGRSANVGVGGLITGGGFSFFGPRYGFVVDNVVNFEVVLAHGQVVNANAHSNPDLFFALKGGSNNFGVVTRFDLKTFEQGPFWGGFVFYPISTKDQQIEALVELAGSPNYDPYAAVINSFAWSAVRGWVVANNLEYTKPQAFPPALANFTNIQPQLFNTMRIAPISSFATELAASTPLGSRQLFATATYGNNAALLSQVYDIADSVLQPIKGVSGLRYSLSLQPVPSIITGFAAASGGNPLGLNPSDGNNILVLITISWLLPADDAAVRAQAQSLFRQGNALAQGMGLLNDWTYLNYAAEWQDPIGGYGAANKAKLQAASRKYDPTQLFQKQVPGGFKLFR